MLQQFQDIRPIIFINIHWHSIIIAPFLCQKPFASARCFSASDPCQPHQRFCYLTRGLRRWADQRQHDTSTAKTLDSYTRPVVFYCSPNRFTCMGFLLLSKGCIPGPHDFASVSGLASHSGCLGPHEFTLVSHLSPTLVSHTCLPHLSPALGAFGRMSLHLFTTCLPHLSPTLVALGRMSLHLSPTCLPHLFPTLVSHTCLPLWVPWAAWVFTCPRHLSSTLVSHSGCLGLHDFSFVSHLSSTPWAAWVYTCLPLVSHTCLSL